ncbi:MAG: urea carboxylase-associated family protein [Alphaproteobacteria bacterium]|nr:urea carboxylase-associated family protein [Alphaproteobacteria bacterium]
MPSAASAFLTVPARGGRAVRLDAGEAIEIVNTHGSQVVDTWALSTADPSEYLSMEQTRRMLFKLWPQQGDALYSNRRSKMLAMELDTSPGIHDTLFACCDRWVYANYGCPPGHANCHDNFHVALEALGIAPPLVPNPLNLWMNIPVSDNRRLAIEPPVSRPGDRVVLRALMDCAVVMSACPMDVTPINGAGCRPMDVQYRVLARAA